ncbi:hypothetical protein ACFOWB_12760 [Chenggangzhangella methanolivorans]
MSAAALRSASPRRPAFRLADLEPKVLGVALEGLLDARRDRPRALRAVMVLDQVARLPSPGLAKTAARAADEIRRAVGHLPPAAPAVAPRPCFPRPLSPARALQQAVERAFSGGSAHAL